MSQPNQCVISPQIIGFNVETGNMIVYWDNGLIEDMGEIKSITENTITVICPKPQEIEGFLFDDPNSYLNERTFHYGPTKQQNQLSKISIE